MKNKNSTFYFIGLSDIKKRNLKESLSFDSTAFELHKNYENIIEKILKTLCYI